MVDNSWTTKECTKKECDARALFKFSLRSRWWIVKSLLTGFKKTVKIDQLQGIPGADIAECLENNAYRFHLYVSPQLPCGFRATFLDALSPLSRSLEQASAGLEDSLFCITCSLKNNAFSVLHYIIKVTLKY